MAFVSLAYSVLLFWLLVHALHRFWLTRRLRTTPGILPSHGATRRRGFTNLQITLKHVYLKLDTTGYNDAHDWLAMSFTKTRHSLWKRTILMFYDVGSVCGVLGMLAAVYMTASTMVWSISILAYTPSRAGSVATLSKRELVEEDLNFLSISGNAARDAPIQLIVCVSVLWRCHSSARNTSLSLLTDTRCNATHFPLTDSRHCSICYSSNPRSGTCNYGSHVSSIHSIYTYP